MGLNSSKTSVGISMTYLLWYDSQSYTYLIRTDILQIYNIYALVLSGYYSDVEVVPGNIFKLNSLRGGSNLPNYYIPWYWMKIATYAKPLGWKMLASPLMDLTHASNTTMEDHVNGLHTFSNIVNYITYMMRDGRGEGK